MPRIFFTRRFLDAFAKLHAFNFRLISTSSSLCFVKKNDNFWHFYFSANRIGKGNFLLVFAPFCD